MSSGACFGYRIDSPLDFAYLRGGEGTPLIVETGNGLGSPPSGADAVLEWTDPFRASLLANGGCYRFWVDGLGSYEIDTAERRILVPDSADPVVREERLWGIPAALSFAARGDLPLHAAAVEVGGKALLIAAPGVFGKTTLAAAFARAGHRVLAEDLSCLRLVDGAAIIPGPAMLRLRRDVAEEIELPPGTVVLDEPLRVHLALEHATRGDCLPVPVRAVVVLKPGKDEIRLDPVPAAEGIRDLLALSFRLPSDEAHRRAFEGVASLVRRVPVWELSRPDGLALLPEVVDKIVTNV